MPKHRIRVNNLPDDFDDEILSEEFVPFGTVSEAKVIMDKETGESRCFGFVTFDDRCAPVLLLSFPALPLLLLL